MTHMDVVSSVANPELNRLFIWGLGGDVWALRHEHEHNLDSGAHTRSTDPQEKNSPYGIYPIWVFNDHAMAGTRHRNHLHSSEGHE